MIPYFFHILFVFALASCSQKEASKEEGNLFEEEYLSLEKLRQNPEQTKSICAKTTNPVVIEQCKKINARPHLYKGKKKELNRRTKYKSPLDSVAPSSSQCANSQVKCRTGNALIAKTQKDRVAECKSLNSSIWRNECFFETAEKGLEGTKLTYSQAAELCTLSESLTYNCLQHLSIVLADQYKTLRDAKKALKIIEAYWQSRDAGLSQKMKTIFWMTFVEMYINKKTEVKHTLFTNTDSELHPYIWAALTKTILETSTQEKTLEERSSSLMEFYQGKKSLRLQTTHPHAKQQNSKKQIPRFPKDLQTILYFGEQRRVLGNTVEEEIGLCFVMAAYILQKQLLLIQEAANHPSPTISTVAKTLR